MRRSTLSVNAHRPLSKHNPLRVVAQLVRDPRLRAARQGEHRQEGPRRAERSEHDGRTHAVQPPGEHQPPEVSNQGLTVNHGAPTAGSGTANLSTGGATDYARVQEGVPLSMPTNRAPKPLQGRAQKSNRSVLAGDGNGGVLVVLDVDHGVGPGGRSQSERLRNALLAVIAPLKIPTKPGCSRRPIRGDVSGTAARARCSTEVDTPSFLAAFLNESPSARSRTA